MTTSFEATLLPLHHPRCTQSYGLKGTPGVWALSVVSWLKDEKEMGFLRLGASPGLSV